MKIIYDNIIFKLQKTGGITNYWKNLYFQISKFIEIEDYNVEKSLNKNIPVLFYRYLDSFVDINKKFIFHSSYYTVCKNKNALNIVTVHDFVYEYYKKGLIRFIHILQKRRAIKNAKKIICISYNTKKDLLKYYPKIDKSKIHVVYHGVSDDFKLTTNKGENSKKIIFVGNRSGYKNFKQVVQALKIIKKFELIIVGGGNLNLNELNMLSDIRYNHYQNISDQKLNSLYNKSFALVYPSLYEGFGLPILESLKAGCPVICSVRSSTGEIGDEYVLKGEISPSYIVSAIKKLDNKNYRKQLVSSGIVYASNFTWKKTAKETLNIYNEVWKKYQ